jgi:hypothetical protein
LYEFVNRNGPFNLFSVSCLIGIVIAIAIYWRAGKRTGKNGLSTDLLTEEQTITGGENITSEV